LRIFHGLKRYLWSVPDSSLAPIAAFAAVAAILVVTPGVGTASLIATVVAHGRRAGYLMALGMVAGAATYAIGAAAGITALLHAFPQALRWIAIGGGAFIIWLGIRGMFAATRTPVSTRSEESRRPDHAFAATGFLIALGNAPLPMFYLVIVPQYVSRAMSPFGGALLLSSMHLLMAGTWMTTLVTVLGRLVDVLRRPRVLLTMQLLTGTALILLGVKSISGAF
jgi:threonine/homoserine/homoserine lactone efflux protein